MAQELTGSSWTSLWRSRDERNDGLVHQGNHESAFFLQCTEAANERIRRRNRKRSIEQAQLANILLSLRPLGLKLDITSLLDSLQNGQNPPTSAEKNQCPNAVFGCQSMSEKLKSSSFPALFVRIGNWERRSNNKGDLVAKSYYAKKRLAWEFSEEGLKRKIEIQWNDIIAMKVRIHENEHGTLDLELNQPPTFHEETDPQPRKHTNWRLVSDFTGGHASICRRHFIMFPPGSLDNYYSRLIQCDRKLYELGQKPFPSLQYPYFEPNICTHTNFSLYPMDRPDSTSPDSVMALTHSDRQASNKVPEIPRMALRGQGISNHLAAAADTLASTLPPSNQVDAAPPFQGYINPLTYDQRADNNNKIDDTQISISDYLFSDAEVGSYDESDHLRRLSSTEALVNFSQQRNPATASGGIGQNGLASDTNEQAIGFGGGGEHVYRQFVSIMPSQFLPTPSMQNFGPSNNTIHFNR